MRITEKLTARSHDAGSHRPVLIACLGDSVTHGHFQLPIHEQNRPGCRPWDAFPMKLQSRLTAMYPFAAPTVLNAGVAGEGIAQMAARLDRDVLSFKPDLVILEVGLNDCLGSETDDPAPFGKAAGELMDRILAAGADAMLLTPSAMCTYVHECIPHDEEWHPLFVRAAKKQNEGVMAAFVNAARTEAEKRGVPVADAYAEWEQLIREGRDTTLLLANYINHPTPEMHDLFAEKIIQTLGK